MDILLFVNIKFTKMNKCLVGFCVMLLISCASQRFETNLNQINPGMERENVRRILGNPGNRQFSGFYEAWQYCNTGVSSDKYYVVWFTSGIVTGLTTYTGYGNGKCKKFYREINWSDRPDSSIQIIY